MTWFEDSEILIEEIRERIVQLRAVVQEPDSLLIYQALNRVEEDVTLLHAYMEATTA